MYFVSAQMKYNFPPKWKTSETTLLIQLLLFCIWLLPIISQSLNISCKDIDQDIWYLICSEVWVDRQWLVCVCGYEWTGPDAWICLTLVRKVARVSDYCLTAFQFHPPPPPPPPPSYIIAGTSYILMMIRCTRSHLAPAYKYFQRRALWREQQ